MKSINKTKFKKILSITVWTLLGIGTISLLVSALYIKENKICTGISIQIRGVSNNFFIDKNDVTEIITHTVGKKIAGKLIREFDLNKIENELKKDVWISKADLFFDRNGLLRAEILEKEPVARVFSNDGKSFYIDDSLNMLPLSNRHAARLPVFTNFSSSLKVLSKSDSNLLRGIKQISLYVQKDSFLMAMIDQINIIEQNHFELIPKIGDQIVLFGDEKNMEKKFEKFKLFYKKIVPMYGWKKYSKVKLYYEDQIVANIRGKEDVVSDSLRTMEMMKAMADYNLRMSADSTQYMLQDNASNTTNESLIAISFQRDDSEDGPAVIDDKIENKPVAATVLTKKDSVKKTEPVAVKKDNVQKSESKATHKKKEDHQIKNESKKETKKESKKVVKKENIKDKDKAKTAKKSKSQKKKKK